MAVKLPSFKLFSSSNAKSRILFLMIGLVAAGIAVYFVIRYFGGFNTATVSSQVAAAPDNLKSVPGGQLSPEYYRAISQANLQASKQAQMTGGSAVPTLLNVPAEQTNGFQQPQQNCTVMCPDKSKRTISDDINDLVKDQKLSQKDANLLLEAAKKNVSVSEYADMLNKLVKEGKLSPEEARALLESYKKQHQQNGLLKSAAMMDNLIRSGSLSLDDANKLLALERSGVTASSLSGELNQLVKDGKMTQQTANALLAQYSNQQADDATKECVFDLQQLVKQGGIAADVGKDLSDMQLKHVPLDQYISKLNLLVAQGKLTPAVSKEASKCYEKTRARSGAADVFDALVRKQATDAKACMTSVLSKEKDSQDLVDDLVALTDKDLTLAGYHAALMDMTKSGKLSQQYVDGITACYQKLYAVKEVSARLQKLQANNASASAYADELKRAVQSGLISPEDAGNLMQEYQAMVTPTTTISGVETNLPSTDDFARLRQRLQEQTLTGGTTTGQSGQNQAAQFAQAASQAELQRSQERQQRIQQLRATMTSQAQTLLTSWQQPAKMQHVSAQTETNKTETSTTTTTTQETTSNGKQSQEATIVPPLIKAGTIYFGVLETAVDSDYPDTPVMVTIVNGPFKGATLIGKLSLAQGQDKVSLNFIMMNRDDWLKSKNVSAFAIDPDTARTVMASSVDHHYLMRYGSLFAASFITGYANAVQTAGSSGTTGIFGTSTTHPNLSPGNRIAVALGQVGTTFGNVVQGYVNTPATVRINSGVGLGILFVSDVS
ncbi:MAG: TrbI/VirB10 family protein [Gammaproteobacteria bacterium]|nr:TrbI/VirB10 family protein [Gammaproteobacteria bacterium]